MSKYRFRSPDGTQIAPQQWLRMWVALYPKKYKEEHDGLIAKYKSLSAEDFQRIGKWKDDAKTENKWKKNVASVAYLVWI